MTTDLNPSPRLLLGPGPSLVHPRVLRAMATPLIGHLDPEFLTILAEIRSMLQTVFQTENELTLAVSGTGTAAMEAALSNLLEPGDSMLACVQGYFGERLAEMGRRYGAHVERLEADWGQVQDPAAIEAALSRRPAKVVTLVHAETSTGACQPDVAAIAAACHRHDALLVLDVVTSLGGLPVDIDGWQVDVAYSAAQKSLSGPPGLSPITVGPRARQAIARRSSSPPVFYFDLELLGQYWSDRPSYHHTVRKVWQRAGPGTRPTLAVCGTAWKGSIYLSSSRNPFAFRRSPRRAFREPSTRPASVGVFFSNTTWRSPVDSARLPERYGASA
ncbi:MAG: Alanine--glyoxylate aminotransferase [Anaerolineales bacterium]|nr:Alanine--glyoxylate aminotransferase [Anaerolineales bacterium]